LLQQHFSKHSTKKGQSHGISFLGIFHPITTPETIIERYQKELATYIICGVMYIKNTFVEI